MARRALIALGVGLALACPTEARAQSAAVRLPACRPAHVDVPLLGSLLELEAGLAGWIVDVGAEACVPGTELVVYYVDPEHRMTTERIEIPEGLDATATARVLALAIAERMPSDAPPDPIPPPDAPVEALPPADAPADEAPSPPPIEAAPTEPGGDALPSPRPLDDAPSDDAPSADAPEPTDTSEAAPRERRFRLGGGARGRLARPLPSPNGGPGWALGGYVVLGIPFDPVWGVRVDVLVTDSHSAIDNSFAVTFAGGFGLSFVLYRDRHVDFFIAPRAELGGTGVFAWNNEPLRPWLTVGAEIGVDAWLDEGLALEFVFGGAGVLVGGPIVEREGFVEQTVLDLSPLFADVGIALVAAI